MKARVAIAYIACCVLWGSTWVAIGAIPLVDTTVGVLLSAAAQRDPILQKAHLLNERL